jgi:hypothetical protein
MFRIREMGGKGIAAWAMLEAGHAEKSAPSKGPFFRSLRLRHHDEGEKAIHKSAGKRRGSGRALLQ